ncbi:hypothetical protein DFH94DRAFT_724135 [Russula ochroleuca]|uniref:Uncharacterized protein n=1 Tax=Russula ochroleuca TaxID=152965 RepID=A0A9P5N1H9_9AGAM|nr:hypothetical protein DFH94DRAFT_724135 [Russula ochroleuca]
MTFSTTTDNDLLNPPSSYPLCNTASHRSDQKAVEDPSLAIHSSIQSDPHHSPVLVSGTRPSDTPVSHTTRNPADQFSFGTVLDAPQLYTPVIPSFPLALLNSQLVPTPPLNVAAVDAKQGSTDISTPPCMANLYRNPISSDEVTSQQSESVIPPSIVDDARLVVYPSPTVPAVTRSGYLPYEQGFASLSPPTALPHISPQVISNLEAHITTRVRAHAHDDTLDLNIPIPTAISRHPSKSALSTPDIAAITLRSGDSQQGLNES